MSLVLHFCLFLLVLSARASPIPVDSQANVHPNTYVYLPITLTFLFVFLSLVVFKVFFVRHRRSLVQSKTSQQPNLLCSPNASLLKSTELTSGKHKTAAFFGFFVGFLGSPTWETHISTAANKISKAGTHKPSYIDKLYNEDFSSSNSLSSQTRRSGQRSTLAPSNSSGSETGRSVSCSESYSDIDMPKKATPTRNLGPEFGLPTRPEAAIVSENYRCASPATGNPKTNCVMVQGSAGVDSAQDSLLSYSQSWVLLEDSSFEHSKDIAQRFLQFSLSTTNHSSILSTIRTTSLAESTQKTSTATTPSTPFISYLPSPANLLGSKTKPVIKRASGPSSISISYPYSLHRGKNQPNASSKPEGTLRSEFLGNGDSAKLSPAPSKFPEPNLDSLANGTASEASESLFNSFSMPPSFVLPDQPNTIFSHPHRRLRQVSVRTKRSPPIGPSPLRSMILPDPSSVEVSILSQHSPNSIKPPTQHIGPPSTTGGNRNAYAHLGLGYPSARNEKPTNLDRPSKPDVEEVISYPPTPGLDASASLEEMIRELVRETKEWDDSLFVDNKFKALIESSKDSGSLGITEYSVEQGSPHQQSHELFNSDSESSARSLVSGLTIIPNGSSYAAHGESLFSIPEEEPEPIPVSERFLWTDRQFQVRVGEE